MPRWIEIECLQCGNIQEVQKEMDYFIDTNPSQMPCPKCDYLCCKELPPLVTIQRRKDTPFTSPKNRPLSEVPTLFPEEVRQILAKELFDPCSCGDQTPADIDNHDPHCHVQNHTFMKQSNSKIFPES